MDEKEKATSLNIKASELIDLLSMTLNLKNALIENMKLSQRKNVWII